MTDTPRFHLAPAEALLRLELWDVAAASRARFTQLFGASLPAAGHAVALGPVRVIWCEPAAWMLRGPIADRSGLIARLTEVAGSDGAVTDISAAAVRCALVGADWRILLTHGGVFDAEDPAFAPGCVAGTVVEHMAVRFDVIIADQVDAYVAPSYAADLLGYWTAVAGGLDVRSAD